MAGNVTIHVSKFDSVVVYVFLVKKSTFCKLVIMGSYIKGDSQV